MAYKIQYKRTSKTRPDIYNSSEWEDMSEFATDGDLTNGFSSLAHAEQVIRDELVWDKGNLKTESWEYRVVLWDGSVLGTDDDHLRGRVAALIASKQGLLDRTLRTIKVLRDEGQYNAASATVVQADMLRNLIKELEGLLK